MYDDGMAATLTNSYGSSTVKRARRSSLQIELLDAAIIRAVEQDKPVTLRGVFYRAMTAGAVPKTELGYRTVGRRLVQLRRDGRVSYRDITDGTRWITKPRSYDGWREALADSALTYRKALWTRSHVSLQLFTEKDAISGVILPITESWDIPLGVLRGYCSESFAWTVGQSVDRQRTNIIAQLGDHDPSGVGAWHDFTQKVAAFAPLADIHFVRLAVTPAQIDEFDLPMRPTKTSDTRAAGWTGGSVEVDAIPAPQLRVILDDWISQHIDEHDLYVLQTAEDEERAVLTSLLHRDNPAFE